MATITLRPDVYDKAAIFARKDKLNIEDWVNKILQKGCISFKDAHTSNSSNSFSIAASSREFFA